MRVSAAPVITSAIGTTLGPRSGGLQAHDLPPLGVDPPPPRITAARARAVIALVALMTGLLAADLFPQTSALRWFALAAITLTFAAGLALRRAPARAVAVLLPVAVAGIAAGMQAVRAGPGPSHALERLLSPATPAPLLDPIPARIRGVLLDDPRASPRAIGEPVTGLSGFIPAIDSRLATLRVEALATESGWARASGEVRLRLQNPPTAAARADAPQPVSPRAGDRLELAGRFLPIAAPTNPGQRDPREWARAHGVAGSLTVPDPRLMAIVSTDTPGSTPGAFDSFSPGGPVNVAGPPFADLPAPGLFDSIDRAFLRFRADLLTRASAALGPGPEPFTPPRPGRTLLADLLLGIDNPADPRLSQAFTRLGLAHVLAISGFHLVVLAAVSLCLIRCTGDRGPLEPAAVAIAVGLYLLIVPASAPVLRSGAMVLGLLVAEVLGRRYDRLTVLAWTAITLLLWRPADLASLGFQLSYGLTGLLLWLGPRFHTALFGVRLKGTLDRGPDGPIAFVTEGTRRLISTSVLCWAVAAPLIAWHTGLFSPLAVLSTLIITPFIFVLLWMGFAGLLLAMLWPGLGEALSPVLLTAGDWTAALVHGLDALPGVSLRVPMFSAALAVAATGVLLYWARFSHRRDPVAWGLTAVVAAWGAVELTSGPAQGLHRQAALRIDALEAGGGSCAIVRTPTHAVLWDCGSTRPGFGRYDLPRAARALGAGRMTTAILSHADLSHFSSIIDAADAFSLRDVLVTPALLTRADHEPQGPAAAALRLLRDRGVRVEALHAAAEVDLGGARLRILSPPASGERAGDDAQSLIGVVETVGAQRGGPALLTGQLADDAVDRLIAEGSLPRGTVLFLPARGSPRALRELLIAGDPRVIVAGGDEPTDFSEVWGGEAAVVQVAEVGAAAVEVLADSLSGGPVFKVIGTRPGTETTPSPAGRGPAR